MARDSSANTAINNIQRGYQATATSNGTTTLTVASAYMQFFTGTQNHTVKLPVVSTLVLGMQFQITNLSIGVLTIVSSDGTTIATIIQSSAVTCALLTCVLLTGTGAASWSYALSGLLKRNAFSNGTAGDYDAGIDPGQVPILGTSGLDGRGVLLPVELDDGLAFTDASGLPSANMDARQLFGTDGATPAIDWGDGSGNTPSFPQGILGESDDSDAASGIVGEYVESKVAVGSATALTTATAKNVTSISLSQGDWDVEGIVSFSTSTATFNALTAGVSTTSATLPTDGTEGYSGVTGTLLSEKDSVTLPRKRINVTSAASPATIYLVGKATFSAGSVSAFGQISARRVR
jgi:hypothetical protein